MRKINWYNTSLIILLLILFSFSCDEPLPIEPPISGWAGFPIVINEFLALNDKTIPDEFGEYEDWVELFNTSDTTVTLKNVFLTDSLTFPTRWRLPDTLIAPKGFLLIWTDRDINQGRLHANFRLNGDGEQLGIFFKDGEVIRVIDTLSFGLQKQDTSYGRVPNGSNNWKFISPPTPNR